MGMGFHHRDCLIDVVPALESGEAIVDIGQDDGGSVSVLFTRSEWRALSRHVEEALREAALLRRRAKSAERRKRDAMKGTR